MVWCQRCRTQSHEASAAKACSPFNGIMRGLAKRVAAIKASSQKLPTHLRCALFKSTASTPWPMLLRLLLGILTSKVLGARSRGLVDYVAPSQASIYMSNCSTPEGGVRGAFPDMRWHDISTLKQSRKRLKEEYNVMAGDGEDGNHFFQVKVLFCQKEKEGLQPRTVCQVTTSIISSFFMSQLSMWSIVFFCTAVAFELRI